MKKGISFFSAHLLAGCYAVAVVLAFLACLFTAAWDALGYATGRLYPQKISLADVKAQDIIQTDDGLWVSSGTDPQLLLTANQQIRTVTWRAETQAVAQQAEGYYAHSGADFSLRRRVWAKQGTADGTGWLLTLEFPLSGANTVRIDPVGEAGLVLAGQAGETTLEINTPRPFLDYFCLRAEPLFWLLLLPALAAGAVDWVRSIVRAYRGKNKKQEGNA